MACFTSWCPDCLANFIISIAAGVSWPIFHLYDNLEIIRRFGKNELGSLESFRNLGTLLGSFISGYIFIINPILIPTISFISYILIPFLKTK